MIELIFQKLVLDKKYRRLSIPGSRSRVGQKIVMLDQYKLGEVTVTVLNDNDV
jgi:hypothetical protein